MRQPIPPTFGPCSGWYQPGQAAPNSPEDRRAMRVAAVPATVVVLRRLGERIPAAQLLRAPAPPAGWLVCMDRYTQPKWHACLFGDEAMTKELLPRLLHVELERESGGVRLYRGIEVDAQGRMEYRQGWLCTPTPERARGILLAMADEGGGAI